ncbi:MAG: DUF4276 family protein [Dysgonomonas sp.]
MKKIAFFVEGQTEQIFLKRLIKELLGYNNVSIILKRTVGGTNVPKQEIVRDREYARKPLFQILIYDCGADNRVKSEILDNLDNLKDSGYQYILGVRDLYPLPEDELSRLEKGLNFLPQKYNNYKSLFDIIVVVQEVETWFLAETHHLKKVDKRLTGHFIKKRLGFNPFVINTLERKHPSKDLNDIYHLVGKSYNKRYWQVEKLVKRLDFYHLLHEVKHNIESLDKLVNEIEKIKNN